MSRHASFCEKDFQGDKSFLEAIVIVLENTLRDLVFYSVGILINMSLHSSVNEYLLECNLISKLIDVLKDSNLEDMDLARVAAKALHNLQNVTAAKDYWTEDAIGKLDGVTLSVGEELDSIMDMATEEEMVQIGGLRDLINALVNDMPEVQYGCGIGACGRKFKSKAELEKH